MNELLCCKKHIHFIGIGGAGMFPIAQILHSEGFYVTGSDKSPSDTLKLVETHGIPVFVGHHPSNINGADLVIYSSAIMDDNEELLAAKNIRNVTVVERKTILGALVNRYSDSVCIAGTHGKTTTTGMLTQIFLSAGLDPTAIIGGTLDIINGNGRLGKSRLIVCEACEYKDTFLDLNPTLSLILNVDYDHMDYFHTMDDYVSSFKKFIDKTKKLCIINGDDISCLLAAKNANIPVKTFGLSHKNNYFATNIIKHSTTNQTFDFNNEDKCFGTVELCILGQHNVYNAVAAISCALEYGVTFQACIQGIKRFTGVRRRFTIVATINDITIIDDYAHHPTEIKNTLQMAKEFNFNRIWTIFQPHSYSRLVYLMDQFIKELSQADKLIVTEIFGAREKNAYNISAEIISNQIDGARWFDTFEKIADFILTHVKAGDGIIIMSAGDTYKLINMIVEKLTHSFILNN